MNNINIWLVLGLASAAFAIISIKADCNKEDKSGYFLEAWRRFASYFITAIIGYFIITIRWPEIEKSKNLTVNDFVLCLAFLIGILGWLPYFVKNLTEGIKVIIERFLRK
jgi:hypothetical protein